MLPRLRIPALLYAALSLALWPSALLGLVHVESAAMVATAGFFIAGFSAIRLFRERFTLRSALSAHIGLLIIPWALLTVTLVWRANCGYFLGCWLFLLFTIPSVGLGVALAYALTGAFRRWHRLWFCILGLLVATVPVAFDLLLHPQLYTYNHIFGGVLGPLYDEELAIRSGLFAFRGLTLLWAAWLILLGSWLRARESSGNERPLLFRSGIAVSALIALVYVFAVPLGINTSAAQIERVLSGEVLLERFVIHYRPGSLTESQLAWIEGELQYRYARLAEQLAVDVGQTIQVYLYPDLETRGALIGSRMTSVTPVWLRTPQIHMLARLFSPDHFGHELVHVFSREFGMPVLRASTAVGLVEGLAVALEPPDGLPAPRDQVAATLEMTDQELGGLDTGPAEAVIHAMNPLGFWSGRSGVSYATTGAFSRYLLDNFSAERLEQAYRTGDFSRAYGQSLAQLAASWEDEINSLQPDSEAVAIAMWTFTRPSLFERYCPHHVPREVRAVRKAVDAEDRGETGLARQLYADAFRYDSIYAPALVGWARLSIGLDEDTAEAQGRLERAVFGEGAAIPDNVDVRLIAALADVYKSRSDSTNAAALYLEALRRLPPYAREAKTGLILRSELSWEGLRTVFRPGTPEERATELASLAGEEPALWFFVALNLDEAGDELGARNAFLQLPSADDPSTNVGRVQNDIVERTRLALLAQFADKAGDYVSALHYAEVAIQNYREEGASGPALVMEDLAAKARWFLNRHSTASLR